MAHSNANNPDLDWSQIRETVRMLSLSVTHVEQSMREGDASVNTLTDSFTSMVEHMSAINGLLMTLAPSEEKEAAIAHCQATNEIIQDSIVAFQFYDRLQQCLEHVTLGLTGLSELVSTPERLYSPMEWKKFQDSIRGRYTMESEKILFDAILAGKTIKEALELIEETVENKEDDIELF